jgi:hypothetical protein
MVFTKKNTAHATIKNEMTLLMNEP